MGSNGQIFTWCNNWRGDDRIYERLDWILINRKWAAQFPNTQCTNEVAIRSDHSPIVMSIDRTTPRRRRWFRFEEMWFEDPKCKEVAWHSGSEWHRQPQGSQLWPKLGGCRRNLMRLSKERFDQDHRDEEDKGYAKGNRRMSIEQRNKIRGSDTKKPSPRTVAKGGTLLETKG